MSKPHARQGEARRDHYAEITNQIIAALKAGTPPWRCDWDKSKTGGLASPQNASTGARYRGINTLVLGMSPLAFMTCDPRWATYKQAAERGWQVRKGAHGTPGFFYKKIEVTDRSAGFIAGEGRGGGGDTKVIPILRSFNLFHASQIDGVPDYRPPTLEEAPWREPEAAAIIARNSRAVIRTGGERAFYSPSTDHVQIPPLVSFRSPAAYASVLTHELAHWTGAEHRLKRKMIGCFGSPDYAREELRAELAQVMICAELGIDDCDFTNGAAYIGHWLKKLNDDPKEVFRAASDAQRIADYLLAYHPAYAAKDEKPDEAIAEDTADAEPMRKAA